MDKLNRRQKLFCEYYCSTAKGSAQKAAEMAGYSVNYAKAKSYLLLQNDGIRRYIDELKGKNIGKDISNLSDIQLFWTNVMNDPGARTSERLKASELLAKSKGAFNNEW